MEHEAGVEEEEEVVGVPKDLKVAGATHTTHGGEHNGSEDDRDGTAGNEDTLQAKHTLYKRGDGRR